VEQEGIEPSSKRGNHALSTRLAQLWFSCLARCRAPMQSLSL